MSRLITRLLLLGVAVVVVVVAVRHFDRPHSVQAVCHVWDTDGLALHNQYEAGAVNAGSDPLEALSNAVSAPGQMATLMNQMASVAPSYIEPDFQSLASAFSQLSSSESSALSNPLSALGGDLVAGLSAQTAADDVDQFLATNCGIPGTTAPGGRGSDSS